MIGRRDYGRSNGTFPYPAVRTRDAYHVEGYFYIADDVIIYGYLRRATRNSEITDEYTKETKSARYVGGYR